MLLIDLKILTFLVWKQGVTSGILNLRTFILIIPPYTEQSPANNTRFHYTRSVINSMAAHDNNYTCLVQGSKCIG
jgi:hypothetical protein